jgi:DnaJ like chaperone protein
LGIQHADYQSLLALYQRQKDANWAYTALEISPSATNEEVKKAYRRMAMKYHPDKVANAGEEIRNQATEKFRGINEAYEYIKAQRKL